MATYLESVTLYKAPPPLLNPSFDGGITKGTFSLPLVDWQTS